MLRANALQTCASLSPAARLQLRHLPNPEPITALQAACLLFVGVQLLLPGEDAGFDFQREFELARGLVGDDA